MIHNRNKAFYWLIFFVVLCAFVYFLIKLMFKVPSMQEVKATFSEKIKDYDEISMHFRSIPELYAAGETLWISSKDESGNIRRYWKRSGKWDIYDEGWARYSLEELCLLENLDYEKITNLQKKLKNAGIFQIRKREDYLSFLIFRQPGTFITSISLKICLSKERPAGPFISEFDEIEHIVDNWWIVKSVPPSRRMKNR
jgi:hypothetical protein